MMQTTKKHPIESSDVIAKMQNDLDQKNQLIEEMKDSINILTMNEVVKKENIQTQSLNQQEVD